jgi:hypothetical protein
MQPQPLPQSDLVAHTVADIAEAISGRPGETEDQRSVRSLVATHLIVELAPCSATELMLAAHTVMFHTLMTDSIRTTLQGEADTMRRTTRAGVIAMNHAFHRNLDKLEKYQTHRSQAANAGEPDALVPVPEPAQSEAAPDTVDQDPAAEASAQALPQPTAPQRPVPLEPIAADLDTEAAEPIFGPLEVTAAAPSANENDAPAPNPLQLNRAQRRLLRHGQHAR